MARHRSFITRVVVARGRGALSTANCGHNGLQRLTIEAIATALEAQPHDKYCLIVLDALYRFLPLDGEENANETMTRVYNMLDGIAKRYGASIVVVRHATKAIRQKSQSRMLGRALDRKAVRQTRT